MQPSKLSALFGVDDTPVQWERPLLLFLALFVEYARWLIIQPVFELDGPGTYRFMFMVGEPTGWFDAVLSGLVTAYAAMAGLRLVRGAAGIAVAALFAALAAWPLETLLWHLRDMGTPPLWWAAFPLLRLLVLFACLEAAMRLLRGPATALLAGSVGGAVIYFPLAAALQLLFNPDGYSFSRHLLLLPTFLVDAVIFALVLTGGLRLATGRGDFLARVPASFMSRAYFTGGLLASGVAYALFTAAQVYWAIDDPFWRSGLPGSPHHVVLLATTLIIGVLQGLVLCRLVYRMWNALRSRGGSVSPGFAVGGLFIPLFNLFWLFRVFPGYAADYNRCAERGGLASRLRPGWLIAFACAILLSGLFSQLIEAAPYAFLPLPVFAAITQVAMASGVCAAVNALSPREDATAAGIDARPLTEHFEGNPIQEG